MLLAAGRGDRMRPLTERTPKPLLLAGGKSLIAWQIERLAAAGITDLVINHAYLGAQIETELGKGERWAVTIAYSAEGEPLETAGGVAFALPLLGAAPFVLANADVYCEFDFRRLVEAARHLPERGDLAHLVLVPNPPQHPAGDFGLSAGRAQIAAPCLTYSGLAAFAPELFGELRRGERAALAPLLRAAIAGGKVSAERFDGYWTDVGTPQRLADLERVLSAATRR
jgi:MurNAc alpha-1-phosphate uridylyltransferase